MFITYLLAASPEFQVVSLDGEVPIDTAGNGEAGRRPASSLHHLVDLDGRYANHDRAGRARSVGTRDTSACLPVPFRAPQTINENPA
jgi:hypothetical protein